MVLRVQGTNSGIYQVIIPSNQTKFYVVSNSTTGGYAITIGISGGSVISIPNGTTAQVYTDGTNTYSAQTGSSGDFTINGNLTVTGNETEVGTLNASTLSVSNNASFAVSPTAPTPTTGDNTTKVATTAFVTAATTGLGTMASQNANNVAITGGTINGVTGTASGLTVGNATTATTATNATNLLSGGTIASSVTATTQSTGDNSTKIATTAFSNPGGSVSKNGWTQLPNGLIFQWGQVTGVSTSDYTVTYPIAFPNFIFTTTCQAYNTSGNTPTSAKDYNPPTKSAGLTTFVITGGPDNAYMGGVYNWMAIGY